MGVTAVKNAEVRTVGGGGVHFVPTPPQPPRAREPSRPRTVQQLRRGTIGRRSTTDAPVSAEHALFE